MNHTMQVMSHEEAITAGLEEYLHRSKASKVHYGITQFTMKVYRNRLQERNERAECSPRDNFAYIMVQLKQTYSVRETMYAWEPEA